LREESSLVFYALCVEWYSRQKDLLAAAAVRPRPSPLRAGEGTGPHGGILPIGAFLVNIGGQF
jgi:hypothetical protein